VNRVPRWRIAAAWAVLALLIAFSAVFAPIYYRNLELHQYVVKITQDAGKREQPDDALGALILKKAQELDLPVKADNVHIDRSEQKLRIDVGYFVRVSFPGYTVDLHFHPRAASK
jgi:hypothetical protein